LSTIWDIPSEIVRTKDDGMPKDCAAHFDHMRTVSRGKIGAVSTRLSPAKLEQVRSAVLFALDLWIRPGHRSRPGRSWEGHPRGSGV